MRGEHTRKSALATLRRGLIPVCAGNTRAPRGCGVRLRAHPRMRGEHEWETDTERNYDGSSPHARGARRFQQIFSAVAGLIPACAGSTPWCRSRVTRREAHPRMHGEHLNTLMESRQRPGLSPHARGALPHRRPLRFDHRLIPACAGSTSDHPSQESAAAAHPRMRGEHDAVSWGLPWWWGSSPHARGARSPLALGAVQGRLIPACAGSTRGLRNARHDVAAHPRMRGEHHQTAEPVLQDPGLIPACAGSTASPRGPAHPHAAHPRMRGEHIGS